MIKIHNDINQRINFVDDRTPSGGAVTLHLTHIASGSEVEFTSLDTTGGIFTIDASTLRIGLHSARLGEFTSFIVKVLDVNSLSLNSPDNDIILGYKKN